MGVGGTLPLPKPLGEPMPDVSLPNAQPPQFPDECLLCGRAHPGDQVAFSARFNGMAPLKGDVLQRFQATAPACAGCRRGLVRSRWVGKSAVGLGLLVSIGLILAALQLRWVALDGWRGYVAFAAMLIVPYALAQRAYTAAFDFAPWSDRVVYSFRDRGYAERFAALNDTQAP